MTEKVLHEVRFIETDDGFRIEVKGDKERMRELGCGPGMMGFGPRFRRRMRRARRWGPGFGPWWWYDEEEEDEEPSEGE